jgi:hypothetical protein
MSAEAASATAAWIVTIVCAIIAAIILFKWGTIAGILTAIAIGGLVMLLRMAVLKYGKLT